jgi:hypothetical protein
VVSWSLRASWSRTSRKSKTAARKKLSIKRNTSASRSSYLITESNRKLAKYDEQFRHSQSQRPQALNIRGNRAPEADRGTSSCIAGTPRLAEIRAGAAPLGQATGDHSRGSGLAAGGGRPETGRDAAGRGGVGGSPSRWLWSMSGARTQARLGGRKKTVAGTSPRLRTAM